MSLESEKKVFELSAKLKELRVNKHELGENLTVKQEREITEKVKSVMSEIVSVITDGAKPCSCEAKPHGMVQYTSVKNKPMPYFEVGCLVCDNKRAQGFSIKSAVSDWNDGKFLAPKAK